MKAEYSQITIESTTLRSLLANKLAMILSYSSIKQIILKSLRNLGSSIFIIKVWKRWVTSKLVMISLELDIMFQIIVHKNKLISLIL